jgi:hypothetical protein
MGRPTVMRSIKRQRVRAAGDDASDAGHEFASSAEVSAPRRSKSKRKRASSRHKGRK